MFPLSFDGVLRLPFDGTASERRVKAIGQRLAKLLRGAAATAVTFDDDHVAFENALFRQAAPWNVLFPFEAGSLQIRPRTGAIHIGYKLHTVRLAAATAGIALLVLLFAAPPDSSSDIGFALSLATTWLVLFGVCYLLVAARFRRWLRRNLREASELRVHRADASLG